MTDDAPYGRHPDGTPKRSNGGRPKGAGSRTRSRPPRAGNAATAPKRKATPNTTPAAERPNYTESFTVGVGFIGAGIAATAPLDGYVILSCADDLGKSLNDLAGINKYVRQLGERMMQVGPYAGLVTVLQRIGAQICENHGWIPTTLATKLGAIPRGQLIAHIQAEQAFHNAQAAQAAQAPQPDSADPYPAESGTPADTEAPFIRTDYAPV